MSATTEPVEATGVGNLLDERQWSGKIFSDGWVDAPVQIETVEPATGEVLGTAGGGDPETIAPRREVAAAAQRAWAQTPFTDRVAVVRRAGDLMERHRPELARWLVRESGSIPARSPTRSPPRSASSTWRPRSSPIRWARAAVADSRADEHGAAGPGRRGRRDHALELPVRARDAVGGAGARARQRRRPEAGRNTPVTGGVVIARLFEEAGLPEGVLHVLPGGAEAGQALVEDPNVRMISFTGSTATGRKVGETAGRMLKKTMLEMGGNCPLVVLDDADIEAASSAGAWGSFLHSGQICISVSRHLVHESIVEEYTKALVERAQRLPVGNPDTEEVALGPIINEKQMARIVRIVDESVAQGAKCSPAGPMKGRSTRRRCSRRHPDHAGVRRGDLRTGRARDLVPRRRGGGRARQRNRVRAAAAVQSRSPQRAAAVAEQLQAGMVHVNDHTINEEPPAPFGGFRSSSNGGHFGGVANLELWTEWQWLTAREQATTYPFWGGGGGGVWGGGRGGGGGVVESGGGGARGGEGGGGGGGCFLGR